MAEPRPDQAYVSMVLCDRKIEKRTEDGSLHIVDLLNVGTREWFTSGTEAKVSFTVWLEVNFIDARVGVHTLSLVISDMSGRALRTFDLRDIDVPARCYRTSIGADIKELPLPLAVLFLNAVLDMKVVNVAPLEIRSVPSAPPA